MKNINVNFDKRMELVFGLLYSEHKLSGFGDNSFFNDSIEPYCSEFVEIYKKHASNELRNYIKNNGFDTYNRIVEIVYSLDDNYNIKQNDYIKNIKLKNKNFDENKIHNLLINFTNNSDYNNFYNKHYNILKNIKKNYISIMKKYTQFDGVDLKEFYGEDKFNINVVLFNFCNGSFGYCNGNDIYNIRNVHNFSEDKSKVELGRDNIPNFYHECSHPYINPLGNKYFKELNIDNVINECKENGLQTSYYNKITIINEYTVRAVQLYFVKKYMETDYYERHLNNQKQLGYNHIEEIINLFERKNDYYTFEEFYKNEIVNFFINFNNKKECKNIIL